MRFPPGHGRQTRARIVKCASAQFRERGPNGLSIADVMRTAGLTHGGFYSHFPSREALVRETLALAMEEMIAQWTELGRDASADEAYAALVDSYLSKRHRDNPAEGCALPSFGAEIGRSSLATRRLFSKMLEKMIRFLAQRAGAVPAAIARQRATFAIASLVGSIVLARASGDKRLSDGILKAGREELLGLSSKPSSNRQGSTLKGGRTTSPASRKRLHRRTHAENPG